MKTNTLHVQETMRQRDAPLMAQFERLNKFLDLISVADRFTLSRNEGGTDSVLHQLLNNFLSLTNEQI